MTDVKICGVTSPAAVDAAIAAGARWIGLVCYPKSPRHLGLDQAGALARRARGQIEIVALTVDADDGVLAAIQQTIAPDWIQLHGREPPARSVAARAFAKRGIIRALPIATTADVAAADAHAPTADWLLFDAKAPAGAALPGGNGAAFDWRLLAGRRVPRPWLLAGGLSPDNVATAIGLSGAAAVDVSSGVESAPGVKDAALIARFVQATQGRAPGRIGPDR